MVTNIPETIISILVGGGVISAGVGAAITLIRDSITRRKKMYEEIKLGMWKERIDTITNNSKYYRLFGNYATMVFRDDLFHDEALRMYFFCKMILVFNKIRDLGGISLDNLDSERILTNMMNRVVRASSPSASLDYLYLSRIGGFVKDDTPYHEFYGKLEKEYKAGEVYYKFKSSNLNQSESQEFKEGHKFSFWYFELLELELNYIFRPWYRETTVQLSEPLLDYLKSEQPRYYQRIIRIGTRWVDKK